MTAFDPQWPQVSPEQRKANFERWFGHSCVVGDDGQPRIVFHGSRAPWIEHFDLRMEGSGVVMANGSRKLGGAWFSSTRDGASFFANPISDAPADPSAVVYGSGPFYAAVSDIHGERLFEVGPYNSTPLAEAAARFAVETYNADESRGDAVIAVYLSIQRPLVIEGVIPRDDEFALARAGDHDGIVALNVADGAAFGDVYVAFRPTQIKSVLNSGLFSRDSDHLFDPPELAHHADFRRAVKRSPR
jgi:hypothetical protein